jgi:lysophospholipase L1-like esterase
MIGRMIRDSEADFISLKLGINVYGNDLSPRTFGPAAIGLISTIREKHKDTPMAICSPIYSPERESTASTVGNTLIDMRETLKRIVELLQKRGDKNIYYVDGLNIFGADSEEHLPDKLHPNAKGMEIMAENFITEVFKKHNIKLNR